MNAITSSHYSRVGEGMEDRNIENLDPKTPKNSP